MVLFSVQNLKKNGLVNRHILFVGCAAHDSETFLVYRDLSGGLEKG